MNSIGTLPLSPAQFSEAQAPRNVASEKTAEAARQFEAIFVRNLLSSLETSEALGGSKSGGSGSDVYGSMIVSALAESATQGSGMGLSELILRALSPTAAEPRPGD